MSEELRVQLMSGALAGLSGLTLDELAKLRNQDDTTMTALVGKGDRAAVAAYLALQVAEAAQDQLGG
ncbi:MAG: hypothetical protein AAF533_17860 [Acidobacteriota bacterium]